MAFRYWLGEWICADCGYIYGSRGENQAFETLGRYFSCIVAEICNTRDIQDVRVGCLALCFDSGPSQKTARAHGEKRCGVKESAAFVGICQKKLMGDEKQYAGENCASSPGFKTHPLLVGHQRHDMPDQGISVARRIHFFQHIFSVSSYFSGPNLRAIGA